MMGGLKRQLNLLAVGIILAVSLLISVAAVVVMDRLAHQLSATRMLSELNWIRFDVGDTHRILKDTGVDAIKSYRDSAQQEIIRKFRDFRIGVTGRLYLVSDDGRIVSAPSDRQPTDIGGPALELVIREKVGHAKLMIAGSPSIVYFDTFPEWSWHILLVISEKEINSARDNFIWIAILILLFSAGAGVFVFAWVANGFVLPILELAKKLSEMKENQLGQQLEVKHRSKEVGTLLNAFHRLSDRLLAAKNTLQEQNEELKVREEELQSQNEELISAKAMLQQSEQRHRSILQTAMDGIFFLDIQGRFVEANETYCRMSGYSIQELLTMSIPDVEYFEKASDAAAHIKKVMEQGEDRFESQHRRKDGSIYDVEVSVQYRSADGVKFVVFLRDITERKRTEEALKSNYALLQIAGETAIFGGWSVDLEKKICTWSDAVADIHDVPHGYSPPVQEAINFYAPEWREKITHIFSACAKDGIPYDEEMEIITQKGKRVWVRATGKAVKNEKDKIIKVQGSFQDITDKKQAEEALRESEEKLQALFSAMTEMVVLHQLIFDDNGMPCNYRILDFNEAFSRITNIEKKTAVGQTATQIYNTESPPYLDVYTKVALSGEPVEFFTYYAPLDRHFLISAVSPRKNFFATITSDITELKKAEAEREKLQTQLHQAQKMESIGRLAGGVAHDFNNMLGVILGHVEFALEKAEENHDLYNDLNEIQKAAQRSANLTKQLLTFARKDIISPKQIDLNDTVESMLNMLRRLIGEDIDLVWQPSTHLWPLKMDPSQIDQILANLCVNARDAIAGVGKLTIETGRHTFDVEYCNEHPGFIPGDFVLLAVSDNGCGMDKEILDNLFEPFFTTKEVGKSTGLGLATIYGIVKQNNGFINVYSEPGQGATFRIYLPRCSAGDETPGVIQPEKPVSTGNEIILLVEDEPAILRMTRMMLERKGYSVLSATTPSEAIDTANAYAGKIHLLMTDVVMPEMNGRNLASQITTLYPDIKLLFMSGYTAEIIAHQGVLDEGVAFIQKPFSMADLAGKVREVLDMASDKS
jgi:PAS domain S-box-containing protein